jgi:hypothetical protein
VVYVAWIMDRWVLNRQNLSFSSCFHNPMAVSEEFTVRHGSEVKKKILS